VVAVLFKDEFVFVVLNEGELRNIGEHSDAWTSICDNGDGKCITGVATIPVEGTTGDPS
jgi:hypothetical protein